MKKLLLIIAALILAFNMTACKDKKEAEEADATAIATEETVDEADGDKASEDENGEENKEDKDKDEKEDSKKDKKDKNKDKKEEKDAKSKNPNNEIIVEDKTTSKDLMKEEKEQIHVESDNVVSSDEAVGNINSNIETEVIYTDPENESDTRPTVYWATSEDKVSGDVAYHKKDCSVIANKKPEELPWEIIDALGMLPCEKCNP